MTDNSFLAVLNLLGSSASEITKYEIMSNIFGENGWKNFGGYDHFSGEGVILR